MANEPSVRDFVLLAYAAFGGKVNGKTMLQKRVYFLAVILDRDLGYEAHYYGPYSAEVASANAELKSVGLLSESIAGWGTDQRGFEMARYDYKLTDFGQRLAERKAAAHPELWVDIRNAAKVVSEAGSLDYMELSIAAKAYFALTRLNRKATIADIAEMLPKFGWSVSKAELEKASDFLKRADLIAIA
jgi:uncharacterized protein YwgA